jgi:hypothetical protein
MLAPRGAAGQITRSGILSTRLCVEHRRPGPWAKDAMMMVLMEESLCTAPEATEPVARWRRVGLLWLLAIAAGLAAGVLASAFLGNPGPPVPLSLEAREQSGMLLIRWNAHSATAAHAQRAVIRLSGPDGATDLACDRACLGRGGISYPWPPSTVDIGMRFTDASGDTTEERTRFVAATAPDDEPLPEPH